MENSADRGDGAARVLGSTVRDAASTGNGHPPAEAAQVDGRPDRAHSPWGRVVVKLSGEAFSGDEPLGISPSVVQRIAREIVSAVSELLQPGRLPQIQQRAASMHNRAVFEIPEIFEKILSNGSLQSVTSERTAIGGKAL